MLPNHNHKNKREQREIKQEISIHSESRAISSFMERRALFGRSDRSRDKLENATLETLINIKLVRVHIAYLYRSNQFGA